jgi:putrescine transport system ATP-binding protein
MNIQYKVGTTFIFVTHDQDEAMALATRIAVMDHGKVIQVGTPAEIYEFPQTRFIADFIGTTNFFEGTVTGVEPGQIRVHSAEAGTELLVDDRGKVNVGQQVWVALRPEKIRLSKEPPSDDRVNRLKGVVAELGYLGSRSTYRIRTPAGKILTVLGKNEQRTSEWSIDWSDEVYVSWHANAAIVLQS